MRPAAAQVFRAAAAQAARGPRGFFETEYGLKFDVIGEIEQIETIAVGRGVKVRTFLRKTYGPGRWRKRKGIGTVRLPNGNARRVELHWYEAHGVGKRDMKIKKYLDKP
jgi:hypothetical protein